MRKKYLQFFWLFALSLMAISGCTQKMAKEDGIVPQPSEQAKQQQPVDQQSKAVPEDSAANQNLAPASSATAASDAQKEANKDMAKQQAPSEKNKDTAAAAALLPLPPKEIVDTIKQLTNHPRVRYLSRSAQYDYYVGGLIDAKYDINKSQLVVTNSPTQDKDSVTCEYAKDGTMMHDKKSIPSKTIEECNKLVNELTTYLAK